MENPGFPGLYRSIGFSNRGCLLVGTGTTVPAGIEKYSKSYKQSTNLAYQFLKAYQNHQTR